MAKGAAAFPYGWFALAALTVYTAITQDTRPLLVAFVVFALVNYISAVSYIDISGVKDK